MLSKTYTKYIQSLLHKKARDEDRVFIAEGPKLVPELLQSGLFACRQLIAVQSWLTENENWLKRYSIEIIPVQDFELEKISALSTPNRVLAVFEMRNADADFSANQKITLLLDNIQDPGNLGTIIRIADWYGIENIICSPYCADVYNPKVVQSTMGSIARVNLVYTNPVQWLQANKAITVYAAALDGKNLYELGNIQEAIIIIGNESKGINDELLGLASEKITIPRIGQAESLNAAVATGIILSQVLSSR